MGSVYVRELSTGEVFRSTLTLYKTTFWRTYLAYALPLLPGYLLEKYGLQTKSLPVLLTSFGLTLVGTFFCYTALALCISDACLGNTPDLFRSFGRTRKVTMPLILTSLLQCLAIFGGFLLLIIPGIVFMLWFAFAPLVVVLEGRSTMAALRRSKMLAKGFLLKILVIVALLMAVAAAWGAVGGIVVTAMEMALQALGRSVEHSGLIQFFVWILEFGLIALPAPLTYIALVLMYYDVRARKEAYDNTVLAAELAR
jgi:hypothetical protein